MHTVHTVVTDWTSCMKRIVYNKAAFDWPATEYYGKLQNILIHKMNPHCELLDFTPNASEVATLWRYRNLFIIIMSDHTHVSWMTTVLMFCRTRLSDWQNSPKNEKDVPRLWTYTIHNLECMQPDGRVISSSKRWMVTLGKNANRFAAQQNI